MLAAQVGYRFNEHFDVLLKGNNLTNEKYYSNVAGWSRQSYYGEPRNIMLTLRASY